VDEPFEHNGIINRLLGCWRRPFNMTNTGRVVLGMVYNYLPYMVLPRTHHGQNRQQRHHAAQDLGAKCTNLWQSVVQLSCRSSPRASPWCSSPIIPFIISRMLGGGSHLLIGDLIELQFLATATTQSRSA
jgi:spermidine/putrescine transport system permease protein